MNTVILEISVEFLFQALNVFDTNISQFDCSLIITINDSGLMTKINLKNWSRSHQGRA